ncbi:peptide chain release factor-like protein [Microcoleus sp. bin48.metabat.b7b8b9.023]|uniref:peptide chain release factor-like protein n=2 Tax=unclassified Microcoleus TaxID=2642155 RepID=UPI0034519198
MRLSSTATVEILQMYVQLEIAQQDLELILPNLNQNRNGTKAWAKIVHIPTGISALCDECPTQLQNKDKALAVLKSKLFAMMQRQGVLQLADIQYDRLKTFLNQPIREYQFASDSENQDKVLDIRTGIETTAIAEVLDGKIDSFLKAGLLLKN